MRWTPYVIALASALAAWAQAPKPPETYSFTATASTVSSPMSIKANRNGPREVIERATIGAPEKFHDRVWYDFQAHRLYTLNLNSKICSTQEYASAYAPGLIDPIGGAAEAAGGLSGLPPQGWSKDTINGIAVKVIQMSGGEGGMKMWLDEKFNFLVRLDMAMGTGPLTTRFEIQQLSYAPSPESLFIHPQACQPIGGVDTASGGHAERAISRYRTTESSVRNLRMIE
jgi:hypothetical protein